MNRIQAIVALFWATSSVAQNNLVPNPSFEKNIGCPYAAGQISLVVNWVKVRGTIDYYSKCGTGGYAVPLNHVGFQDAKSGDAYVGIVPWVGLPIQNAREFIGVALDDVLKANAKYDFSMYLSKADTVQYAIKNMAVLFTESQPVNDLMILFNSSPQVRYSGDSYLSDHDWMLVEGSFIAVGGEQFLTIGNFDDDTETDTLSVMSQPAYSAYYYLDDVSLVEDTTYHHVGIVEGTSINFGFWPNPATEAITIEMDGRPDKAVELYDIAGRMVLSSPVQSSRHTIGIGQLPTGVYVAVLREKGVAVARRKLVKQ